MINAPEINKYEIKGDIVSIGNYFSIALSKSEPIYGTSI